MAKATKELIVTIAIPTFNGEDYLEELLTALFQQQLDSKYEVLIIDSGSTDKTLAIIDKFPDVRLHKILNSEFGHGKTRNLAASMAKGEFIVFLSQDATPAHPKWLESMIEPFYLSSDVFCVLGKQTPRPRADATTKREVTAVFGGLGPSHSIMLHRGKSLISGQEYAHKLTFLSDVNSAIRISYLRTVIPYQDVDYAEDQLLGIDVLNNGYIKAYAPEGNVMHSNEYPLRKYYSRRVDEFNAVQKHLGMSAETRLGKLCTSLITDTLRDYLFTLRDPDYSLRRKIKNIVESPLRNFQKKRASYIVGTKKNTSNDSLEATERKKGS